MARSLIVMGVGDMVAYSGGNDGLRYVVRRLDSMAGRHGPQ